MGRVGISPPPSNLLNRVWALRHWPENAHVETKTSVRFDAVILFRMIHNNGGGQIIFGFKEGVHLKA